MHTLLGLLELEMYDDAVEFVGEVVGDHRATAEQVTERIEAGRLRIMVQHTYPLAEAAEAHRTIEAKRTTGKIVLVP